MQDEQRPVAIVTGGASGIGAAACERLARDGFAVVVADRDDARARAVAARVGGRAYAVDAADEAAVRRLFADVRRDHRGALTALATCAGIVDATPFMEIAVETFRRVHEVNVIGTFLCIREAARMMPPGSSICTISSVAGKRGGGLAGTAAYASSKGAVLALTRNAARSLAERGIRVNSVAPGTIDTPFLPPILRETPTRERVIGLIPAGRFGEPGEIADAIAFLLSERASYVNGETFTVDGGMVMD